MHGRGRVCSGVRTTTGWNDLPAAERPARSAATCQGKRGASRAAAALLAVGFLQGVLGQSFSGKTHTLAEMQNQITWADINPNVNASRSVNTDPWDVWSTRPSGKYSAEQNMLLVQGELRHTVARHDFEAFKRVLSEQGCISKPAPASCEVLIHHGDAEGRTIYHLIGKYGYGGDYHIDPNPKGNATGYYSPEKLMEKQLLQSGDRIYRHSKALDITPELNLRDISGQTPLHEAALHGRVLTIRAMVLLKKEHKENVFTQSGEADGFLRAKPLLREWSYGWTMMNFAAMSARDSALRQTVQTAMKEAMENQRNFAVTKGMTIMDYAAINGHAAVVDYLGYLEGKLPQKEYIARFNILDNDKDGFLSREQSQTELWQSLTDIRTTHFTELDKDNSDSLSRAEYEAGFALMDIPTKGLKDLGFASSNWGEAPVQKAIALGHLETVKAFINNYGCSILEARSEGGETVLHNAVGAGAASIVNLLKEKCPGEFAVRLKVKTKLDPKRYLWSEETPCLMSQKVLGFINDLEFGKDRKAEKLRLPLPPELKEFPDGFPGYHRYRCTHDPRQSCVIDSDCQATAKDGVDARCDLSKGQRFNVYDLLHHFETCRLVCESVETQVEKTCGPKISTELKTWLTGEPDKEVNAYGPRDPSKGPPRKWAQYREDPFDETCPWCPDSN